MKTKSTREVADYWSKYIMNFIGFSPIIQNSISRFIHAAILEDRAEARKRKLRKEGKKK